MPYDSNTHTPSVTSILAFLSATRTHLDQLFTPFRAKIKLPQGDLYDKVVIVTGANSGIGFETANALAGMGARVVLACRNETRAEEARKKIVENTGNAKVEVEIMDCGSLASVRAFVERWGKREKQQIDILINNAGALTSTAALTEDGFELTYQSNHLSHVLLTHLLLDRDYFSPSARIISVSSSGLYSSDVLDEQSASGSDILAKSHNTIGAKFTLTDMMQLYFRSKASQAIWTMVLQRRLAEKEKWKGITAHSCHPGTVKSEIWSQPAGAGSMSGLGADLFKRLANTFGITAEEGAFTSIWLSVAPEPTSPELRGMFWDGTNWRWVQPWTLEANRQERLWDLWCKDAGATL